MYPFFPANADMQTVFYGNGHMAMGGFNVEDSYLSARRGIENVEKTIKEATPITGESREIDFRVN